MELPKSIRVGFKTYKVESWDGHDSRDSNRFGEMNRRTCLIRIAEDIPDHERANSLLHEVLHAAYWQADLEDGDPEEKTVTVLSNVLCHVWQDNPALIKYLNWALKPNSPR